MKKLEELVKKLNSWKKHDVHYGIPQPRIVDTIFEIVAILEVLVETRDSIQKEDRPAPKEDPQQLVGESAAGCYKRHT